MASDLYVVEGRLGTSSASRESDLGGVISYCGVPATVSHWWRDPYADRLYPNMTGGYVLLSRHVVEK